MKLLIEILKILGVSLVVAFVVLLLCQNFQYSCAALDPFIGKGSFDEFLAFLDAGVKALIIWIIGFVVYFLLRTRIQFHYLVFFSILTASAMHGFMVNAIQRPSETNKAIKQQLCRKSSGNEMLSQFKNLTIEEYNFLNSKSNWVPKIPNEGDSINIFYYHDDFLGDFQLNIDFVIPNDQPIDSLEYPEWKLINGRYSFEAFQS